MFETVIVGCGYVGSAVARIFGSSHDLLAVRRSATPVPGARLLRADVSNLAELRTVVGPRATMIYAVSPDGRSDESYEAAYESGLRNALVAIRPRRFVVVTSTGVMSDAGGAFVDERTPLRPESDTARRLANGEALARRHGGVVLRLGGIYGPGRDRLIRSVRDGTAVTPAETVYTNRIHRDDAARAAMWLLQSDRRGVYLGVDGDPAELRVVHEWIATRLGVSAPPVGETSRSRSNKRCRNARLRRTGFRFEHPSFRSGYETMIRAL